MTSQNQLISSSRNPKVSRVLLLTAKKPAPGSTALHYGDLRPPMGLGYIARILEDNGIEVLLVDNYVREQDTLKAIEQFDPQIIGLYMHTPGFYVALDLLETIRPITTAKIVVGGPHASLMPDTIPDYVDHVVQGEGEHVMLEMCQGVEFPRIVDNSVSGRITKLDVIKFPDYKHFINEAYNWEFELYGSKASKVLTMHTSRSCPYRCSFCGVEAIWTRRYTYFSADVIVREIDHLVETYGADGIYFREDLFTANHKRVRRFAELLKQRDYSIEWACEARADITDHSLIELMYESGCRGLYVGVESGDDGGLDKKKKDLDLATMRQFFATTNSIGLATYATFAIGTPGETEEEIKATEDFIAEINPTSHDKFAYLGLPKSQDYNTLLETKDYYHIDSSGIIYTEKFFEMAHRLYDSADPRLFFLKEQKRFLAENKDKLSATELASYRFPGIISDLHNFKSSQNDFVAKRALRS